MTDPQALVTAATALLTVLSGAYVAWSKHRLAQERAADKRVRDHHNELRAAITVYKQSTVDLAEAKASAHREVERLFDLATVQRQTIERIETELAVCEAKREQDRREGLRNASEHKRRKTDR